jgi:ABC-type dipeptide/oligopeptide/nickel transport system permease component
MNWTFARAIVRRLGQTLLTLLVTSMLVWGITALTPGDPARRVLNARGMPDPPQPLVEAMRDELKLDRPAVERYVDWLASAVQGDLGISWRTGRPVSEEFTAHLPATLNLAFAALLIALAISIPLAMVGASTAGRWPDWAIRVLTLALVSTPSFLLGVLLLHIVVLRWGVGGIVADGSFSNAWMPALALAAWPAASWARILRGGLLEAMSATYQQVSTARGAGRLRLLVVHALPNAAVPFLAIVGVSLGWLLAGTPVVETVFTWPGIGRFTVDSIVARDVPVIQAFTLFAVLVFVGASLLVDLASGIIDPRLRRADRAAKGAPEVEVAVL